MLRYLEVLTDPGRQRTREAPLVLTRKILVRRHRINLMSFMLVRARRMTQNALLVPATPLARHPEDPSATAQG